MTRHISQKYWWGIFYWVVVIIVGIASVIIFLETPLSKVIFAVAFTAICAIGYAFSPLKK